jgi:hypothetical protein
MTIFLKKLVLTNYMTKRCYYIVLKYFISPILNNVSWEITFFFLFNSDDCWYDLEVCFGLPFYWNIPVIHCKSHNIKENHLESNLKFFFWSSVVILVQYVPNTNGKYLWIVQSENMCRSSDWPIPQTLRDQILHTSLHLNCEVTSISMRDASTFSPLIIIV